MEELTETATAVKISDISHPSGSKMDVSFSVGYHTDWGQNVYLVGDLPELGEWQESKAVKMWWTEGNVWTATITLPTDVVFHYKYLILGENDFSRWEKGPNRSAKNTDSPLKDAWEFTEVTLAIYHQLPNASEVIFVNGDLEALGQWDTNGPVPMKLATVPRILPTEVEGICWELTFNVPRELKHFRYQYLSVDAESDAAVWEREPGREMALEDAIGAIPSRVFRQDMNFVSGLIFDKLTDFPIFIGPYPQNESDAVELSRAGITAVLNVQSRRDFTYRKVNWPALLQAYERLGIEVVHIPMADFDRADLIVKLPSAAEKLDELYGNGKSIYVHCTAGMGRAPAVVIYYLVKYHNFSIDSALKLVRESRPIAVPNESALREVLE